MSLFLGSKTYFILGRKSDQESTAETTMWMEDSMLTTVVNSSTAAVTFVGNNSSASSYKKANSLPSILDEMANSCSDSGSSHGPQETPLRTTRSVSQDRKRKLYHQQRSQQDELSPLSAGTNIPVLLVMWIVK